MIVGYCVTRRKAGSGVFAQVAPQATDCHYFETFLDVSLDVPFESMK